MWYIDRAMGNPVADTFYVNQARQTLRQLETFDISLICEARLQTSRPPLTSIENVQTGWYLYRFKGFYHIKNSNYDITFPPYFSGSTHLCDHPENTFLTHSLLRQNTDCIDITTNVYDIASHVFVIHRWDCYDSVYTCFYLWYTGSKPVLPAAGTIAKGLLVRASNTAAEMMKRAAGSANKNKTSSKLTDSTNSNTGENPLTRWPVISIFIMYDRTVEYCLQ